MLYWVQASKGARIEKHREPLIYSRRQSCRATRVSNSTAREFGGEARARPKRKL